MRLLDRYLLRELLTPLAFCLGGFLIFWLAFDLFSRLNELQGYQLSAGQIAWYYALKMPDLLVVVMPVGLLLALLYALTTHARHHELTAIRAAGVSLWRLALPYVGVGLVFSLAFFVVNEWWGPSGGAAAEQLLKQNRKTNRSAEKPPAFEKLFFKSGRENRIWVLSYNRQTHEMRDIHVDWQLSNGGRCVFAADRGIRTNRQWYFFNVCMQTDVSGSMFPTDRILTNELAMPQFTETPAQIESEIKIRDRLNRWQNDRAELPLNELIQYLRLHPNLEGRDRARLYTKLHGRLAAPWACLVVVLIAIPFGAASGRRNAFVGVASGIFICFAYFILLQVGLALGAGGYLPPWLAAWLPNLLFGVTALIFTFRVR
jgi:lipopolysaccharide export system permease protein